MQPLTSVFSRLKSNGGAKRRPLSLIYYVANASTVLKSRRARMLLEGIILAVLLAFFMVAQAQAYTLWEQWNVPAAASGGSNLGYIETTNITGFQEITYLEIRSPGCSNNATGVKTGMFTGQLCLDGVYNAACTLVGNYTITWNAGNNPCNGALQNNTVVFQMTINDFNRGASSGAHNIWLGKAGSAYPHWQFQWEQNNIAKVWVTGKTGGAPATNAHRILGNAYMGTQLGGDYWTYGGSQEYPPNSNFLCDSPMIYQNATETCTFEGDQGSPSAEYYHWLVIHNSTQNILVNTISQDDSDLVFNPVQLGLYDVSLFVENTGGNSTKFRPEYIQVNADWNQTFNVTPVPTSTIFPDLPTYAPIPTIAPIGTWGFTNTTQMRQDILDLIGTWAEPVLGIIDTLGDALDALFAMLFYIPNAIIGILQGYLDTIGEMTHTITLQLSTDANFILQVMKKAFDALPWKWTLLICYAMALDFIYLLMRGET